MKFEEILPLIRQGKKARMQRDKEDGIYWMAATTGFCLDEESIRYKTIVRMQKNDTYIPDRWSWGMPCWAVMSDDWEIIE